MTTFLNGLRSRRRSVVFLSILVAMVTLAAGDADAACTATLSSPSAGASITFPRTFSWSISGTCTSLTLAFATSSSPSNVAIFSASGSSMSISATQWDQVKAIIGTSSTYYWTVGELIGGLFYARASYRSFSVSSSCTASLSSPSSGASVAFPQTFSWSTSGTCSGLTLAFATSSSPSNVASFSVSGSSMSVSSSQWDQVKAIIGSSSTYYWSVGELIGGVYYARTSYRSFSVASNCTASLSSPSSGASVTFPQTFSWSTSGTCSGLTLAFATSSSPSNVASFSVSGSSMSVSSSQWDQVKAIIGSSSTYYWSVGELIGGVYYARTSYRSFSVASNCTASLSSPSSGASVTFPQTFSWSTSGTCSGLTLAFATSSSPSNVASFSVSGSSMSVSTTQWDQVKAIIGSSSTYYWSVGELIGGVYYARTSYRSFTAPTNCTASLSSPSSGASLAFPQTFSWSTSGTCSGLTIAFATSSSPSNVASISVSGTSTSISTTQWGQVKGIIGTASTYYWSIGELIGGVFYARASYRSFTEASSCSATLSSPAAGASVAFPQTFSWSTSGTCSGLTLAFATSSTPSNVASISASGSSMSVSTTQWDQVKAIIGTASTYYWSIGELIGGVFYARASYRSFTTGSSTVVLSSIVTSPKPPVNNNTFTFTITGTGFNAATAEVYFLGPGCSTSTSCVVANGSLTTKTTTTLAGSTTLRSGSFLVHVRNGSGGTPSNGRGLFVAAQSGSTAPRALILLVDFPDEAAGTSRNYFDAIMFGSRPAEAPRGSLRDYFSETSYGTFIIDGAVNDAAIAWVRLPQNSTYYAGGCFGINRTNPPCVATYPQNAQKMVEDAVAAARTLGLNFGPFDANADGFVDALFVVHAGRGGESSGNVNDIWSHAWVTRTAVDTGSTNSAGQSVFVSKYTTEPEFMSVAGDMTIGVYAHEYGHTRWGLPDLYDIDDSSRGTGHWSLMSGGSWNGAPTGSQPAHLDAWSKASVGFVTPTRVTSTLTNEAIDTAATTADVYQLLNGSATSHTGEYFLVENRQRTGFDAALPSAGLAIWHIDESQSSNANENYPGCTGCSGHYKVQLVQSDNRWDLEKSTNSGDASDLFPGVCGAGTCNTALTGATSPHSRLWNGQASGVSITSISASGSRMTATFSATLDSTPPSVTITSPTTGTTHTAGATPVALGGSASDNVGVTQVTCTNAATGTTVTATGTTSWTCNVALLSGSNAVTVTARDAANNTATDTLTVTYSSATAVSLSASDPNALEAGASTGSVTFTRTGSTSQALTVNYTAGGTATNGSDYSALSGSIQIPAGQSSAVLLITPIDDALLEAPEYVSVALASGSYTIGSPNSASVTITDNDASITVSASDASASESGPDPGRFTLSRNGSTLETVTLNYALGGTAANGTDYASLSGSVLLLSGSSSVNVTVTPLADSLTEPAETVTLTVSSSQHYQIGSPSSATVTIENGGAPRTSLYLVTPCRMLDTRMTQNPIWPGSTRIVAATNVCGIPAGARALAINVTVAAPAAAGWLTFYPADIALPNTSTISFRANRNRATNTIATLSALSELKVYNGSGGGDPVHFIIDVTGYFR